jgi:hypothetical protein
MATLKGWLQQGVQDAQREARDRPELRTRVANQPSGFLAVPRLKTLPTSTTTVSVVSKRKTR